MNTGYFAVAQGLYNETDTPEHRERQIRDQHFYCVGCGSGVICSVAGVTEDSLQAAPGVFSSACAWRFIQPLAFRGPGGLSFRLLALPWQQLGGLLSLSARQLLRRRKPHLQRATAACLVSSCC
jgi:hypothetical protein